MYLNQRTKYPAAYKFPWKCNWKCETSVWQQLEIELKSNMYVSEKRGGNLFIAMWKASKGVELKSHRKNAYEAPASNCSCWHWRALLDCTYVSTFSTFFAICIKMCSIAWIRMSINMFLPLTEGLRGMVAQIKVEALFIMRPVGRQLKRQPSG